ncbi:NrfD/PsrC family molybdoenzyme membrane anchor subunit [Hippea maritima]|uniref:Polysulphide reductase NrfD n=1 Tax=Hippea maritima (strain ATCC 700847 / DSM 10411 / MH2) TaxID=760142 RepID=F2LU08_HIPMA|nr:NrfD/PsrC family molybdoenzyme membrane anchor subunit [Hippea maritima]AEA33407.1 Polysulphide reductase NrfD [Hippea maritima DSM 10411]
MDLVQQHTWGWFIAIYLFFGGLGGATMALGILGEMRFKMGKWFGIGTALLGLAILSFGLIWLVLDLIDPFRFLLAFWVKGIGHSWIARGMVIINGAYIFGVLYALAAFYGWETFKKWMGYLAMFCGFGVTTYTGLLLNANVGIPFWHTPALPVLFTVSAFSTGCALLMLVLAAMKSHEAEHFFHFIEGFDIFLISLELLVIFAYFDFARLGNAAVMKSAQLLLANPMFTIGFLVIGLITPLILEAYASTKQHSKGLAAFASVLVLIGGFLLRYLIVWAGVFQYPHGLAG